MIPGIDRYRRGAFKSTPGWMHALDLDLFDLILAHQLANGIRGDLLEIGSFHGKSAIALGFGLRDDEALTVCDMFGAEFDGVSDEGMDAYDGLTVAAFREQYQRFHERPPFIHQCPSTLLELEADERFRFAHIDGGHAYDVVARDIELVHQHALNGVVVLDDYRSVHTPGVSAAAWETVAQGLLFPFMLSEVKLYAATTQAGQEYWLDVARRFDLPAEEHEIHGYPVRRVWH